MDQKYFYNTKTRTLHIENFCHITRAKPFNIEYFSTEQEALAFAGRTLRMCAICQRKRELESSK